MENLQLADLVILEKKPSQVNTVHVGCPFHVQPICTFKYTVMGRKRVTLEKTMFRLIVCL